jgi:hypothetical protein
MKKQIYTIVGLIIMMTGVTVTTTFAQFAPTAKAHIPFDFSVINRTITAGDFAIKRLDDQGRVWLLSSRDSKQNVISMVLPAEPKILSSNGKLTFRRYGDKYFLASIETADDKMELLKSRAERNLQKSLNQINRVAKNNGNGVKPEIVAIEIAM